MSEYITRNDTPREIKDAIVANNPWDICKESDYNVNSLPFQQIVDMLNHIFKNKEITKKIELLIGTFQLIPHCLHNVVNEFLTSDDLISIISYCLTQTSHCKITANVQFISDFIDEDAG